MLTSEEVEAFVENGFVRIEEAVPRAVADRCRAELWAATGCDPDDPATWTRPVVRLDGLATAPFREAANQRVLHEAFDRLVGPGRWHPRQGLGTFPARRGVSGSSCAPTPYARVRGGPRSSPRAARETCSCATPSSSIGPSVTGDACRGSWRSLRSTRPACST